MIMAYMNAARMSISFDAVIVCFLLRFRWHSKHSYNRQFYRRHLQV